MVSASTRRLAYTTICSPPCAQAESAVATDEIATPKKHPPRTRPTSPSPLYSRNHNFMRNAPFCTLFYVPTALSRGVPPHLFVQAFWPSATQPSRLKHALTAEKSS